MFDGTNANKLCILPGSVKKMGKTELCFGIICETVHLEDWQVHCVKNMLKLEGVQPGLVILTHAKGKLSSGLQTIFPKQGSGLTRLMKDVPLVDCELVRTETGDCFSKTDLAKIHSFGLDVILNFSSGAIGSEMIALPRYGVWAFQHEAGKDDYFRKILHDELITFAALHRVSAEGGHHILKKGCFSLIRNSYKKNRENITSAILDWPAQVLRELLAEQDGLFHQETVSVSNHNPERLKAQQIGQVFFKLLKYKGQRILTKLFQYEYWNVGIVPKPVHEFLNDPNASIHWLIEKKDVYYADPFAYKDEDGLRIVMEELDHRVVKGFISGVNVRQTKKWDVTAFHQAIMKFPFHMSYPYLIHHENDLYCIPETSEAKEAVLYKLNKAAQEWEKVKIILKDFPAVDSTIVRYGDYWWLFCTKLFSTAQSHNNELHIFYADDLFGEWKPHLKNPVKIDIRSSRPAGTPFIHEGALIRPAQDCSKTYGGRIVLNRIHQLTVSEFVEEPVAWIEPQRNSLYPDGVHTISSAGDVTILDGKRFDYHILHFFKKLYRYKPVKFQLKHTIPLGAGDEKQG